MTVTLTKKIAETLTPKQAREFSEIVDWTNRMGKVGDIGHDRRGFLVRKGAYSRLSEAQQNGVHEIAGCLHAAERRGLLIVKDDDALDYPSALRIGSAPAGLADAGTDVSTGLNRTADSLGHGDTEDWSSDPASSRLPGGQKGSRSGDAERSMTPEQQTVQQAADRILSVLEGGFETSERVNRRDSIMPEQRTRRGPVYSNPETDLGHDEVIKALAAEVAREMRGDLDPIDPDAPSNSQRVHNGMRGVMRSLFGGRT